MSRKRKADPESVETTTSTETPAAVAEAPSAEAAADKPSFAESVGKKKYAPDPDPFGIAGDYAAGVYLFESKEDRQMAIKFGEGRPEDKPSQAVLDKMHEAGWKWNPAHKIWAHPVRAESAMRTRIDAEKLFQEVAKMIRKEKGIEDGPGQGVPF